MITNCVLQIGTAKPNPNRSETPHCMFWTLALALLLGALPMRAESASNYSGPLWEPLDSKKVLADAASITVANYPDSDEATVEKKAMRVYRADGTGEAQDETFIKVMTEKGKRGNRTLSLGYMLPYFT